MVLFGADIYAHAPEVVYWLLASSVRLSRGVCCSCCAGCGIRAARSGPQMLERSVVPSGVYKAQRFLDEIAVFAREG